MALMPLYAVRDVFRPLGLSLQWSLQRLSQCAWFQHGGLQHRASMAESKHDGSCLCSWLELDWSDSVWIDIVAGQVQRLHKQCMSAKLGLTPAVGQLSGTPDTIAHGCCYDVVGSHKVVCHTMAREFEHVCTCRCTCWRLTPSMGLAVMAWHGAERDLLGTKSACCGVRWMGCRLLTNHR